MTSNVDDFMAVAESAEVHPGIILVEDGALLRDEQEQIICTAMKAIRIECDTGRDLVNSALIVVIGGRLAFVDVPESG